MNALFEKLNLFKRNKIMCEIRMEEVQKIINLTGLDLYGQAIISLNNHTQYATEYLNRPANSSGFQHPGEFYSFAANHGMIADVDVFAIENVLQHISNDDVRGKIFINVHLSTLFSSLWDDLVDDIAVSHEHLISRIVLEVSEREGLGTYSRQEVQFKISAMREKGLQFAIDDMGIGYSGLANLTMVKPDYVKIDRDLVQYIDEDPYRQHLMTALTEYWQEQSVKLIVEGVERIEETHFFATLGAPLAQGYFYDRPQIIKQSVALT